MSLQKLEIKDGDIAFDNRRGQAQGDAQGLQPVPQRRLQPEAGRGQDPASADTASVSFAGIPYLNRVRLGLTADAQADLANKSYVLKQTELGLNDLKLGVSGSAKSAGKLLGLDLAFKAPSTNFRSILSLVPAVYAHDFDKVKTSGSFTMEAGSRASTATAPSPRSSSTPRSTTPPSSIPISRSRPAPSSWIWRSAIPAAAPTAPW